MSLPSAKQYAEAFQNVKIHPQRKKAVLAVYSTPEHKATPGQIASLAGFKNYKVSNSAFGNASKAVAKYLKIQPPLWGKWEQPNWWSMLSKGKRIESGFEWELYPEVVSAIKQIGWYQEADYFIRHADDIETGKPKYEGAAMQVMVTIYERSKEARQNCVRHYGCKCSACDFDFESFYGEIGRDYIHVHHLVPIAEIGEKYVVDPINDLIPVCPNCHAMLHIKSPPLTIEDLRRQIQR